MDLIDKYGDRLGADDLFQADQVIIDNPNIENTSPTTAGSVSTAGQMMTGFLAIVISIAAGFIG